ncbi:MAG: AAA family ATPase [Bacteroidetes bacterium SB0662_bin_6]|nr:AAA family ATPase [Bacteroidetes bacterium SB0668_bin_1]MYE04258.1 AAA family ATPase [Bacteroidetes bacterium SB0662_bin_6]
MNTPSVPIILQLPDSKTELEASALDFASRVAQNPPDPNLSRSAALKLALRKLIENWGVDISDKAIDTVVRDIQNLRRGTTVDQIILHATSPKAHIHHLRPMTDPAFQTTRLNHFEVVREYPDSSAAALYNDLSGLDEHKKQLLVELELLLFHDRVSAWSKAQHDRLLKVVNSLKHRVPLIIFQGDVGTGKTALAECIGDALSHHVENNRPTPVHLLKLTTQVRGSGLVGEMSKLISSAFDEAITFAQSRPAEPVLLLLDEADALASTRESTHMHHEDRAGLNTLIQRLDNLRLSDLRLATLFITNRPGALDPAIQRRASLILRFERPSDDARRSLFANRVPELNLTEDQLNILVRQTGPKGSGNDGVSFTASDITERLLGNALRESYANNKPLSFECLTAAAQSITPTPPFREDISV